MRRIHRRNTTHVAQLLSQQTHPNYVATILGKTRLWDAEEVKAWHAQRPGSPIPNHP
ncbi:hypothetical protein [Corynebacterium anserum]|uniref:hypothetical protein n=1 Tax=Corynebacterium anserum TaxID=2684406 RepID=UPI0028BF22C0|nr:hypothetical protein [Corynebacterium anserum]